MNTPVTGGAIPPMTGIGQKVDCALLGGQIG
jgi:hypothetical protein